MDYGQSPTPHPHTLIECLVWSREYFARSTLWIGQYDGVIIFFFLNLLIINFRRSYFDGRRHLRFIILFNSFKADLFTVHSVISHSDRKSLAEIRVGESVPGS